MHRFFSYCFFCVLFALPLLLNQGMVHAKEKLTVSESCWHGAAARHGVDVYLLYAVAWVESRHNPSAIGKNKNGSTDMGLMQINSIWLPELAKHGIRKEHLMDGCTSIYVGAWIMAKNFKRFGYTWRGIGAYNSATPHIGYAYAKKVYAAHAKIVEKANLMVKNGQVSGQFIKP